MDTVSYTAFRAQLARMLDKVSNDHKPILVTRQNGKPTVVISLEDFHSYQETDYLKSSPKNSNRLSESIAQAESGNLVAQELIEE